MCIEHDVVVYITHINVFFHVKYLWNRYLAHFASIRTAKGISQLLRIDDKEIN